MVAQGIDATVECGPGKVLAGLNKRIDRTLENYSIDTPDNFDKFIAALKG
jgi:[acyl-carrier-protein] S-malonyltransferase